MASEMAVDAVRRDDEVGGFGDGACRGLEDDGGRVGVGGDRGGAVAGVEGVRVELSCEDVVQFGSVQRVERCVVAVLDVRAGQVGEASA